jgi:hypothetical protein
MPADWKAPVLLSALRLGREPRRLASSNESKLEKAIDGHMIATYEKSGEKDRASRGEADNLIGTKYGLEEPTPTLLASPRTQ